MSGRSDPEHVEVDGELGVELHPLDPAHASRRQSLGVGGVDPDAQRKRMHDAVPVDERGVLGEQARIVVLEGAERERALASSRGQHHGDRPGAPREGERVEPDQADPVEMLSDPGEQEQVGGLVDEMDILAGDRELSRRTVEHRDGLPEVVDHRAPSHLVDDVARRHERRRGLPSAS